MAGKWFQVIARDHSGAVLTTSEENSLKAAKAVARSIREDTEWLLAGMDRIEINDSQDVTVWDCQVWT